jgi:hypothetical protein
MAERITAINGKQLKAAVAADGLMKDVNQNLAVDVSDFAGTGLEDDGSENLRIAAAAAGAGLTGGGGSALAVGAGDGIDVATDSVAVDVTDFIDTAYGLEEDTNNIRVNIDAAYFEFSVATGEVGAISLKNAGIPEVKLDIFNAPTANYVLSWDATEGKMRWVEDTLPAGGMVATDVVANEIPTGFINDSNVSYTLANTPAAGTVIVVLNGLQQEPGSGLDYTLSGSTVTFAAAPNTGDILLVNYVKA